MRYSKDYSIGKLIEEFNLDIKQSKLNYRLKTRVEDINSEKEILKIEKINVNDRLVILDKKALLKWMEKDFADFNKINKKNFEIEKNWKVFKNNLTYDLKYVIIEIRKFYFW